MLLVSYMLPVSLSASCFKYGHQYHDTNGPLVVKERSATEGHPVLSLFNVVIKNMNMAAM
jgi:hypothetical protein